MVTLRSSLRRLQRCLPLLPAAVLLLGAVGAASAQDVASIQHLFEQGKDQEAVNGVVTARAHGANDPALAFLAAQAHQRLDQDAEAQQEYAALAARPEADWKEIGASGAALASGDLQGALAAATVATMAGPENMYAHYQLGLVRAKMTDWSGATAAFERAADLDPFFAYAQYYAGLANSRLRRGDRTVMYLERFVKLAPAAPERPAAESLLRTLRGR